MATEQDVINTLAAGWALYSQLTDKDIQKKKSGCGCCENKTAKCLYFLLTGLKWRYAEGVYDDTTDSLVEHINRIVGETSGTYIKVYFGYFDTQPIPANGINYQFHQDIISGSVSYGLNFTESADNKWLSVREPISEPIKTEWRNTSFNYGIIPDQVWLDAVEIAGYRYYVSRRIVALQQNSPSITFSST